MPKKEHEVLEVATKEKFSKNAVYIWYGWTSETRIFVIYVGSTTKGSKGGPYGKKQVKNKNVKNPIRIDLHRFTIKDWKIGDRATVKFTKAALRAYETRAMEAIKKYFGGLINKQGQEAECEILNIRNPSQCCEDGKCRHRGCTECCGENSLPTKLPSMFRGLVKKKLDEFKFFFYD